MARSKKSAAPAVRPSKAAAAAIAAANGAVLAPAYDAPAPAPTVAPGAAILALIDANRAAAPAAAVAALARQAEKAPPVAAPAPVSATAKNAAAVVSALADGPLTVAALAERLGITATAVRNGIDNVRRVKGRGAIVALGGTAFGLPG